ncbi:MAG: DUF6275 family protein [Bilifractor sp.]
MNNDFMIQYAKKLAAKAIDEMAGKLVVMPRDMYVVWFCKTLQNWKALVSTDVIDSGSEYGDYVEVTHNGDKGETYCDVYKKQRNVCYKDFEV